MSSFAKAQEQKKCLYWDFTAIGCRKNIFLHWVVSAIGCRQRLRKDRLTSSRCIHNILCLSQICFINDNDENKKEDNDNKENDKEDNDNDENNKEENDNEENDREEKHKEDNKNEENDK